MKTNPNDILTSATKTVWKNGHDCTEENTPLTKREYFAAMAMQGIEASNFLSMEQNPMTIREIATRAVSIADALIEKLNRKESEK